MRRRLLTLAVLAVLSLAASPAMAQDSSVQAVSPHFSPAQAGQFSRQVERDLMARGAEVALVFRAGRLRSQLPKGISYTHGAFWVRRRAPDGALADGYEVHNLYAGDGANWSKIESRLVQDRPLDFTRASTVDDMGVIVPSPQAQAQILAVINSPTYEALHNPAYSLVANPWRRKYQNCNNFMLQVIGAGIWGISDPDEIIARLKTRYTPTVVKADAIMRFFGPIADQRLRTDDQDAVVRTSTYESLAAFLKRERLLQTSYVFNYAR